ncbi:MAG: NUDIX hydrolase [Solirubrobacteraceae bacterium]
MRRSALDGLAGSLLSVERAEALELPGAIVAAVLVTLYEHNGALRILLTERHRDLPHHAGEISFPGGQREPDDPSLLATALRESHEEIGLDPDAVTVAGALQPTPTIATGYAIHPFVGVAAPGSTWMMNPSEVSAVIELPLVALAAGYARRRLQRRGVSLRADTYLADGHMVWGATARILADLLDRLSL